MTIAIIDSGIDTDSPEFAGRLSASSRDVAGSRGLDNADSDHGTNVAMVAAAARDNVGVLGIAYQSTIAMFRADDPGSCATPASGDDKGGCNFSDGSVAAGINAAVAAGAKVINLSLGGDPPDQQIRNAIATAAVNGVVVVVSAGNDGDSTDPLIDPNQPDPFGAGLRAAGNGNVIIAGSVNASNVISAFSNRAGSEAAWYLAARGERVCCSYKDGTLEVVTQADGSRVNYVFSGTSFSAPQITGAIALLRQAFPNLSAKDSVDILLSSARDAGASGTDAVYGRGILDIAAAFAPRGQTTLAGSSASIPLGDTLGVTSAAMGDATSGSQAVNGVVLDSYQRAYRLNIPAQLQQAQRSPVLARSLLGDSRQIALGTTQASLAFSVDNRGAMSRLAWQGQLRLSSSDAAVSRVLAGRAVARIAPRSTAAFAFAQGADGLVMQLQGRSQPAFLVARNASDNFGFAQAGSASMALRRQAGPWGVTLAAERGSALAPAAVVNPASTFVQTRGAPVDRFAVSIDRDLGTVSASFGANWLHEQRSVVGAQFHRSLGSGGAQSLFLDTGLEWRPGQNWRMGAALRGGLTYPESGGSIAQGSRLLSSAWSFDASRLGVFGPSDSLSLRIAQPLRIEKGGLNLTLPVAWSYVTQTPTLATVPLSLSPHGREIDSELAWRGPWLEGNAAFSLFYRHNPGHTASLPADAGVAASWSRKF